MSTSASAPNLKPLSLAQRPLQLRSTSPAVSLSSPSNRSTPTGTPKEAHSALPNGSAPENASADSRGPLVNGSVQRHKKRFSTLSYSSSPRSPSAPNTFQSPIQASFSDNGDHDSPDGVLQGPPAVAKLPNGNLSRNSSRTWKNGNRNSMDISLIIGSGKRGSLNWERSEPGTPGSVGVSPAFGQMESAGASTSGGLTDETTSLKDGSQEGVEFDAEGGPNVNAVMTLAEKHADLLHFIAQKEAKCLELRTQLAQHEADLKALKSKWTTIIQKANPSAGSASPSGSLTMAGAAVLSKGVGRLFSNVTAPLASALDALDTSANTGQYPPKPQHRETDSLSSLIDGGSASYFPKVPAVSEIKGAANNGSRGHTPVSSNGSSASSFAVSRHSVSSNSSMSVSSLYEETKGATTARNETVTEAGSHAKVTRRASTLGNYSPSTEIASNSTDGTPQGSNPLTSWTIMLSDMDTTKLNKRWEEIQKGDALSKGTKRMSSLLSDVSTSFINTFAPPINEPLRSQKPRLTSNSSSSSNSSRPSSSQTARPPSMTTNSSSKSLLDEDDELIPQMSSSGTTAHIMGPIKPSMGGMLVPSKPNTPSASPKPKKLTPQGTPEEEDDEVWNW